MKKSLGVHPYLFPMPVLMVATYDEEGTVDVMNMAWGGICEDNMVALNIGETHKTAANLKAKGAFTVSIADIAHLAEADYFGIVSANNVPDKFARSGLHAVKSEHVDAPVVQEFPVTLECRIVRMESDDGALRVMGEIINVLADESVLADNGKIDVAKLNAFAFDPFQLGYYAIGEKVGQGWTDGKKFKE